MSLNKNMAAYYAKRAASYEDVYAKSERQDDLPVVRDWVRNAVAGHRVLEVACGTGYWTEQLAQTAAFVLATDINEEVIEIAQSKKLPEEKVRFALADAFSVQVQQPFSP